MINLAIRLACKKIKLRLISWWNYYTIEKISMLYTNLFRGQVYHFEEWSFFGHFFSNGKYKHKNSLNQSISFHSSSLIIDINLKVLLLHSLSPRNLDLWP
jgi:hypothetical protein